MRQFLAPAIIAAASIIAGFSLGRATAPERGTVIAPSVSPGWVEVRRDGQLVSEWQARDGVRYSVLVDLLDERATPPAPEASGPEQTIAARVTP